MEPRKMKSFKHENCNNRNQPSYKQPKYAITPVLSLLQYLRKLSIAEIQLCQFCLFSF